MADMRRIVEILAYQVVFRGMPLRVALEILNSNKDELKPPKQDSHEPEPNRSRTSDYHNTGLLVS